MKENTKSKLSKKTSLLKIFLVFICSVLLSVLIFVSVFCTYCAFDKSDAKINIPPDFTAFASTDSILNIVNFCADFSPLQEVLNTPDFEKIYPHYLKIKNSRFRKNKLPALLFKFKADIAFYSQNEKIDFTAVLDLGPFSFLSRIIPFFANKIQFENLEWISKGENDSFLNQRGNFFIYKTESRNFYVKTNKNLLVINSSPQKFLESWLLENEKLFKENEYKNLHCSKKALLKFSFDANKIYELFENISAEKNESIKTETFQKNEKKSESTKIFLSEFLKCLKSEKFQEIEFFAKKDDIFLKSNFFLKDLKNESISNFSFEDESEDFYRILSKESSSSKLCEFIPGNASFFLVSNFAPLQKIKSVVFSILKSTEDLDSIWNTADKFSKNIIHLSLDEILFSWTGNEFALYKFPHKKDFIFTIEVSDERQRQKVFSALHSSFVFKNSKPQKIGNVNFCILETPWYLKPLPAAFKIDLPKPYYFADRNFIYFSESLESLFKIYAANNPLSEIFEENFVWKENLNTTLPKKDSAFFKKICKKSAPLSADFNISAEELSEFLEKDQITQKILSFYKNFSVNIYSKEKIFYINLKGFSKN